MTTADLSRYEREKAAIERIRAGLKDTNRNPLNLSAAFDEARKSQNRNRHEEGFQSKGAGTEQGEAAKSSMPQGADANTL